MKSPRIHSYLAKENYPHFITTNTFNKAPILFDSVCAQIISDEMFFYASRYDIEIIAFVIMPDHLHCIILPNGEKTFMQFMQSVKGVSARLIIDLYKQNKREHLLPRAMAAADAAAYNTHNKSHMINLKYKIWQPSFFDYLILSYEKLEEKIAYIERNPIEAGLISEGQKFKWLYINRDMEI